MSVLSAIEWDTFLSRFPDAHILQTRAWGELKASFGWQPVYVCAGENGAQVLFRSLPLGLTVAYIPRGPVGNNWSQLWPEIDRVCRQKAAVLLKVEPDLEEPLSSEWESQLKHFQPEAPTVQPRRSIAIDLSGSEEEWLSRMKQKTRYNIRLAERKGIVVKDLPDVETFHRLMLVTGQRDGFGVHNLDYLQKAYDLFAADGKCALLIAEFEGKPLAGLMAFAHGRRAWYFYGASNDEERSRMPTYLLQWEGMRWAAARGCSEYDLWGIPDAEETELEEGFTDRHDGLWGVYRFKRGFGGRVTRSPGAWDRVYNPLLYRLYLWYTARRKGEP